MVARSINGWEAPPSRKQVFKIPGTNRKLTLDPDAGRILTALATDYHRTVRRLDIGAVDEAGSSFRMARGASDQLSNHASATAIDLNWTEEGAQGSSRGAKFFAQAKHRLAIETLKRRYGKWVQWGGDWRAKDYMHWEIRPGISRTEIQAACILLGIDEDGVRADAVLGSSTKS